MKKNQNIHTQTFHIHIQVYFSGIILQIKRNIEIKINNKKNENWSSTFQNWNNNNNKTI